LFREHVLSIWQENSFLYTEIQKFETETKYESALFYFLKCYNNSEIY